MLHIAHIAYAVAVVIMYIIVLSVSQHFILQLSNNLAIAVW